MRKFKHKTLEGVTAIKLDNKSGQYKTTGINDDFAEFVPAFFIENSNDWEEVKEEPNYLITAFRFVYNKSIWKINNDGRYGGINSVIFSSLENMLTDYPSVESGDIEIYSVKNSKGVEWTLNDEYTFEKGDLVHKITSFSILENELVINHETGRCSIDNIVKLKNPLYITSDFVEMFEGNIRKIYLLNHDLSTPSINEVVVNWNLTDKETADRYLTFAYEENRDKYIKENTKKPIFISADGVEYYFDNGPSVLYSVYPKDDWTEKQCNVKQAMEFKNWIHFGKYTARQEYIDNNKPKFSLKEIESCYPAGGACPIINILVFID